MQGLARQMIGESGAPQEVGDRRAAHVAQLDAGRAPAAASGEDHLEISPCGFRREPGGVRRNVLRLIRQEPARRLRRGNRLSRLGERRYERGNGRFGDLRLRRRNVDHFEKAIERVVLFGARLWRRRPDRRRRRRLQQIGDPVEAGPGERGEIARRFGAARRYEPLRLGDLRNPFGDCPRIEIADRGHR